VASKAFARLTNPIIRPADGSARFVFKPLGVIATELWIAFLSTVVPGWIALAAVPQGWRLPVFLVGVVLVPVAMHRAVRISVAADDEGLTVKNYWRTRTIPWGDIAAVTLAMETVGVALARVIAFRTTNNTLVKAVATSTMDKGKRVLVRELKACPELENVPFNLPPKLLA
jgi:hypothetical protein